MSNAEVRLSTLLSRTHAPPAANTSTVRTTTMLHPSAASICITEATSEAYVVFGPLHRYSRRHHVRGSTYRIASAQDSTIFPDRACVSYIALTSSLCSSPGVSIRAFT